MIATLLLSALIAAAAPAPADAQIAGLLDRVHDLETSLNRLDAADGPAARTLVEKHWSGVQDYLGALLQAMPPIQARAGEPDCRVRGTWHPLGLPAEVDVFRYRSVMHAVLPRLRTELQTIRGTYDPAERSLRAQAHWSALYQDVQDLRGLGWMFGRWLPSERIGRVLPEPDSDGAKLVTRACTQCHALPPPSLHTGAEWHALVAQMRRHMVRADAPIPVCVTPLLGGEGPVVEDYLRRHGRP